MQRSVLGCNFRGHISICGSEKIRGSRGQETRAEEYAPPGWCKAARRTWSWVTSLQFLDPAASFLKHKAETRMSSSWKGTRRQFMIKELEGARAVGLEGWWSCYASAILGPLHLWMKRKSLHRRRDCNTSRFTENSFFFGMLVFFFSFFFFRDGKTMMNTFFFFFCIRCLPCARHLQAARE